MRKETKKILEKRLDCISGEIAYKEDKIYKWRGVCFTGLLGMGFGVLSIHNGRVIAGGIIAASGLLFKMINNFSLVKLQTEKNVLKYSLEHTESVIEYDLGDDEENNKSGKHFRK